MMEPPALALVALGRPALTPPCRVFLGGWYRGLPGPAGGDTRPALP